MFSAVVHISLKLGYKKLNGEILDEISSGFSSKSSFLKEELKISFSVSEVTSENLSSI